MGGGFHADFIAIDFETASRSFDSACSVGIAVVDDLRVVETRHFLIRPPALYFERQNIAVHGITPEMVADAPTLDALWADIGGYFSPHCPVVAHNARFDMSVLRDSMAQSPPDFPFVDSMSIASLLVSGSRSLAHCAEVLNIEMEHHHNAASDAKACAEIAICGIQAAHSISMWEFLALNPRIPIRYFSQLAAARQGKKHYPAAVSPASLQPAADREHLDPTHPFFGKAMVFTGELSLDRKAAMQMAVNVGAVVKSAVSGKTDYLVVGKQDAALVGANGLSAKEERAYALNKAGKAAIRFLTEEEFFTLLHANCGLVHP